jgi:toxin CcdB
VSVQHDVHRLSSGVLVVDLQTDLVDIGTRVVAPLVPKTQARAPLPGLEPVLNFDGQPHVMLTSEMTALPQRLLGPTIGDVREDSYTILRAVDMVFTGI